MKKVIVIGLDGLEPKLVEAMLSAGELPNLAKLREQGGYKRVRTTYPPPDTGGLVNFCYRHKPRRSWDL